MTKTISIISEEFENEKTGEKVEGITIIVDGVFKEFLDIKIKDIWNFGDEFYLV